HIFDAAGRGAALGLEGREKPKRVGSNAAEAEISAANASGGPKSGKRLRRRLARIMWADMSGFCFRILPALWSRLSTWVIRARDTWARRATLLRRSRDRLADLDFAAWRPADR